MENPTSTPTQGLDRFFAKLTSGGLILRLSVVLGTLLLSLALSLLILTAAQRPVDWTNHVIAFGLLAAALCISHAIEGLHVDPQLVLGRLGLTTAVRVGLPLIGIVLLDRVLMPGFLASTLIFCLVGFTVGLLTSVLISLGRLSRQV